MNSPYYTMLTMLCYAILMMICHLHYILYYVNNTILCYALLITLCHLYCAILYYANYALLITLCHLHYANHAILYYANNAMPSSLCYTILYMLSHAHYLLYYANNTMLCSAHCKSVSMKLLFATIHINTYRAISLVGRTTHSSEDYNSASYNNSILKDDSYKIDTSSAQLGA